ncbi:MULTISPECIES: hypothetical protein [unclassified Streptosporangium]|uniref:hypothetical protein n=1 Tax=unclassified Streptosporangium TaxID=2632669 RepID=UPI002E2BF1F9|nr:MULTISPECIES: hypothetical protein [unclassified Streptosporangium]
MRVVIKTVGTVLSAILLSYPFWAPEWGLGILGEIGALGMPGGLIAIAVFFGLVALYCRALQRTMTLIGPEARTASPASVWWMFAIPYNFTEDFFIVRAVSTSLAASTTAGTRVRGGFVRWWTVIGYGWCAFQILSLFPGTAGYVGGAIALPLWAAHWIMTGRVNRRLATRQPAVPLTESL